MKIVFLSPWFSEKMGYAENCLPSEVAAQGHEVYIVTTNANPYFDSPNYHDVYEAFLGPALTECGTFSYKNVTLIRLPLKKNGTGIHIRGLFLTLSQLKPDIVQTFGLMNPFEWLAAWGKYWMGYKFFTGNHLCVSVFSPARDDLSWERKIKWHILMPLLGKMFQRSYEKCYSAQVDGVEIGRRFYGVPESKNILCPLGVDTMLFTPITAENRQEREKIRQENGVDDYEILCLYTGRFTEGKNPFILAEAIDLLNRRGEPYKGLFIGSGSLDDTARITNCVGCVVHDFVPNQALADYYRAADIGVWPQQESTSMLDAAATGLPLVISENVLTRERIDGNGLTYREHDVNSLVETMLQLKDLELRKKLGQSGREKIQRLFSWSKIAQERIGDYLQALRRGK